MSKVPYNHGDPIEPTEVAEVLKRLNGFPRGPVDIRSAAQAMIRRFGVLRWEFEVNRLRGFAIDYDEVQPCGG